MKPSLAEILVTPEAPVLDAMKAIERGSMQIALVVDSERRLLATVTDGDIRRGLLKGVGLDAPVSDIMRHEPTTILDGAGRSAALKLMRDLLVHHIPVVDADGRIVRLEWADDLVGIEQQETWVVLMAGGLGSRLMPLTEHTPKPMMSVGGRPILESIVQNFSSQGFRHFYISVNHCREVLQDYFGDGTKFGVSIKYLEEDTRLGTAGALSLLPSIPSRPVIVMNCDVLTSVRFENLLRFHADSGAEATMCAREYTTQIPYGVVQTDGNKLVGIEEKPTHSYFVNAGIYALSPSVLELIQSGISLDMPDLFRSLMKEDRQPAVFPIGEYWLDIGRTQDLERARDEYQDVFGK